MNKIYTKDIVKDTYFPVGRNMMEDGVWTPRVMERCNKLIRISEANYNYNIVPNGLSRKKGRSEKEIVGYYANLLERDLILNRHLNNADEAIFAKNCFHDLQKVFLSSCILTHWDCYGIGKKLVNDSYSVFEKYLSEEELELCSIIANSVDSREIIKLIDRWMITNRYSWTEKKKYYILKAIAKCRRIAREG